MMMDWYYAQLEETTPLTFEKLDDLNLKHYDSGRPYQVGDIILYGLKQTDVNELTLITFHIDEINTLYKVKEPTDISQTIPVLIPMT
jgi:hypothetical protein